MKIEKYRGSNHWGVFDEKGELVCVTVYKKGAKEVVRRLEELKLLLEVRPKSYSKTLMAIQEEVV